MSKISTEHTTETWISLRIQLLDRKKLLPEWEQTINIFKVRIEERYFDTIDGILNSDTKSIGEGFAILTLECAIIEYLATLKDGMIFNPETGNKKNYYYSKSEKWYEKFLNSEEIFKGYFHGEGAFLSSTEFYKDVRCALVHEAQTRKGWTVNIYEKDKKKDKANEIIFEGKKIYRTAMNKSLRKFFNSFCRDARKDDFTGRRYRKFIARKLDAICEIDPDNRFWW